MDLSEAFDTINDELLVAKLHVYGFSIEAHEVFLSQIQVRWQRGKINATFNYLDSFTSMSPAKPGTSTDNV